MGHNVDLCMMLGAPQKWKCTRCGSVAPSFFDDYDTDCGDPNPEPGVWMLRTTCLECDHGEVVEYRCKLTRKRA